MKRKILWAGLTVCVYAVLMTVNALIAALLVFLFNRFGGFGYNTASAVEEQFRVSCVTTLAISAFFVWYSIKSAKWEATK